MARRILCMELTQGRLIMVTIPKIVYTISYGLVLCIGLNYAYAAHPQAETHPSDTRGSQGNQDMIKGDSTPKKGQDEKVDETKLKEDKKRAREEFDQRNAKGQEEMIPKVPKRTLQNDLAPLTRSTLYVRVGPKGGLHATSSSHRRTDSRQIA